MHIHAFSPMEIVYGVELTGMPLADYLSMLRDNGLGTLPEPPRILDDEIRPHPFSQQLSTAQWVEVIRTRPLRHPTTSTLMYDIREPDHWVRQMRQRGEIIRDRRLHRFVPLGLRIRNVALHQVGANRPNLAGISKFTRSRAWCSPVHQQHSSELGEVEPPSSQLCCMPGQRLRRHVDGREYLP